MEPSRDTLHLSATQSTLGPSQELDGDSVFHQQFAQYHGYSPYQMPDFTSYNEQRSNLFSEITDSAIIENGAHFSEYSTEESDSGYEFYPSTDENNLSPNGVNFLESKYHSTCQQPAQLCLAELKFGDDNSVPEIGTIESENLEVNQEYPELPKPDDIKPIIHGNISANPVAYPLTPHRQPLFRPDELPNSPNFLELLVQMPFDLTSLIDQEIQRAQVWQLLEVARQVQPRGQQKSQLIPSPRNRKPSDRALYSRAYRSRAVKTSDRKCPICDLLFNSKNGLTQHQSWVHSGDRNFPCTRCNRKHPSQAILDKHIILHEIQSKPFNCPDCSKHFNRKQSLWHHILKSHLETTP